jgi:glutamate-1-semialdehyde 2,1-aminomutase
LRQPARSGGDYAYRRGNFRRNPSPLGGGGNRIKWWICSANLRFQPSTSDRMSTVVFLARRTMKKPLFPDVNSRSSQLFKRACAVMPGGSSRSTIMFPPYPVYAVTGVGCRVTDVDGVERIDFVNNYSSLIHGHCHPATGAAVRRQLGRISAVGLPTESEVELAELLTARIAAVEQIRFVNSGTEAVMLAVKAARAITGRSKIAKVEGAYHGLYDFAEISQAPSSRAWGPADAPFSVGHSPGTPKSVLDDVIVLPFNDAVAAQRLLEEHAGELAAILLDVMPAHLGLLQASAEFLSAITKFTSRTGVLLILDEVYSLRLHHGGAQALFGLRPDLTAMGKIIGGGFPIGAVGGSREMMKVFDVGVRGRVLPHGGTYNANPISMTAGVAAMQAFDIAAIAELDRLGEMVREGLKQIVRSAGVPTQVFGRGSLICVRFTDRSQQNYRDLALSDEETQRRDWFHRFLLNRGILCSPHGLLILSTPMGDSDVSYLLETASDAFKQLAKFETDVFPIDTVGDVTVTQP